MFGYFRYIHSPKSSCIPAVLKIFCCFVLVASLKNGELSLKRSRLTQLDGVRDLLREDKNKVVVTQKDHMSSLSTLGPKASLGPARTPAMVLRLCCQPQQPHFRQDEPSDPGLPSATACPLTFWQGSRPGRCWAACTFPSCPGDMSEARLQ